jgi:uncharacterized protein with PIN domain
MRIHGHSLNNSESSQAIEQVETALARLQLLKGRVSELRLQCEELKKKHSEKTAITFAKCDECGKAINKSQAIIVKDSAGKERSYYHKECFGSLWH